MTFGALLYFKESRYVTFGALNFGIQYRIQLQACIPVSLLTITINGWLLYNNLLPSIGFRLR